MILFIEYRVRVRRAGGDGKQQSVSFVQKRFTDTRLVLTRCVKRTRIRIASRREGRVLFHFYRNWLQFPTGIALHQIIEHLINKILIKNKSYKS